MASHDGAGFVAEAQQDQEPKVSQPWGGRRCLSESPEQQSQLSWLLPLEQLTHLERRPATPLVAEQRSQSQLLLLGPAVVEELLQAQLSSAANAPTQKAHSWISQPVSSTLFAVSVAMASSEPGPCHGTRRCTLSN